MAPDRIEILGLRALGRHGVYPSEKVTAQPFLVDLLIEADLAEAAASDALAATLDYAAVARRVASEVAATSYDLIEALAARLADVVLEDPRVGVVTVRVAKPEAALPVEVDQVAVVLRRERAGT